MLKNGDELGIFLTSQMLYSCEKNSLQSEKLEKLNLFTMTPLTKHHTVYTLFHTTPFASVDQREDMSCPELSL